MESSQQLINKQKCTACKSVKRFWVCIKAYHKTDSGYVWEHTAAVGRHSQGEELKASLGYTECLKLVYTIQDHVSTASQRSKETGPGEMAHQVREFPDPSEDQGLVPWTQIWQLTTIYDSCPKRSDASALPRYLHSHPHTHMQTYMPTSNKK